MEGSVFAGNLGDEKYSEKRGWFIGHFVEESCFFKNDQFEVRWAVHPKGDKKLQAVANRSAKTISILIRGKFVLWFPKEKKEVTLAKEGDFVFWDANIAHTSEALADSTVLTIRWPSIPNDQKEVSLKT